MTVDNYSHRKEAAEAIQVALLTYRFCAEALIWYAERRQWHRSPLYCGTFRTYSLRPPPLLPARLQHSRTSHPLHIWRGSHYQHAYHLLQSITPQGRYVAWCICRVKFCILNCVSSEKYDVQHEKYKWREIPTSTRTYFALLMMGVEVGTCQQTEMCSPGDSQKMLIFVKVLYSIYSIDKEL